MGFKERCITTISGHVRLRRRLYKDGGGNYRFLLDEAMGLKKRCQASPRLEELATFLSSHMPFEKCERLLKALVPEAISHTTIHRLAGRVVDVYVEEEAKEVAEVFEDGVMQASGSPS